MGSIIVVTGPPGVGKSTLVSKIVYRLRSSGVIVGGFITTEVKVKGVRTGFNIRDLTRDRTGVLASSESKLGPKLGRYRVNLTDLSGIGAEGLEEAARTSELIVIDEVGPMELVSPEFRRAVGTCIDSGKPMLVVLHERLEDDLLARLRVAATETFMLTTENRDTVADGISTSLLAAVGGSKVAT